MNLSGATRRKDEKYKGKEIKNQGQKEQEGKVKVKVVLLRQVYRKIDILNS